MLAEKYCLKVAENFERLKRLSAAIHEAADIVCKALRDGRKVMLCGNGGSAADAQHIAAELMGRFLADRSPLPAVALTTDTSALTAIGNDYDFEEIFSRQVRGLGKTGDVLVGISTSGNSRNVIRALEVARDLEMLTIGLTGETGGCMRALCDLAICVPSNRTNHIQEMHIAVGHMICAIVENELCSGRS